VKLGLIAGNGRFPLLVLDAARGAGHDVTVGAIKEEALPAIAEAAARAPVAAVHWGALGQLGKCISALKGAGVSQAVMAGQVKHTKLFAGIVPDMTLLGVLMRLKARNTDALISGVADALRDHGIDLLDSTAFLTPLLAGEGCADARAPTDDERVDLEFGYRMADALASLDVGQTVVVKSAAVAAVEAMEGPTRSSPEPDSWPGPARGSSRLQAESGHAFRRSGGRRVTIEAMQAAGVSALSVDAGKTLMIDGDAIIKAADRAGICIVGRRR
jgi:DUF1009 family protein